MAHVFWRQQRRSEQSEPTAVNPPPVDPPPIHIRTHPPALLVLGSFVLAMLILFGMVAEITLRLGAMRESSLVELQCAGSGALLNGQKGLFELDPESGYKMQPNLCIRLQSDEYDQVLKTNSHGFVGPEVPSHKAPGEFRIVVLGDSYTAGGQVPYQQNYTALLEDDLHRPGSCRLPAAGRMAARLVAESWPPNLVKPAMSHQARLAVRVRGRIAELAGVDGSGSFRLDVVPPTCSVATTAVSTVAESGVPEQLDHPISPNSAQARTPTPDGDWSSIARWTWRTAPHESLDSR